MKFEQLNEKNNKMLERKEVSAYAVFEGATPKREEVKKELCAKIGANPEMSVLRKLETHYGSTKARVVLHAYEKVEKMKETEPKHLLIRDGIIKKEVKGDEEKAEEKPKEEKPAEKKEEPKKEEKKEAPKKEEKKAEEKPKEEKPAEKKEEKK